nr:phosphoribosylanthranilate isomerase [Cytophagales bacterium]
MIVKVCGMREEENVALLLAEAAPDLMGLIFYPQSKRYVAENGGSAQFFQQLPQRKVGVFVNETIENVERAIVAYGLSHVQLHGEETPDFIAQLKGRANVVVIKVFPIDSSWEWHFAKDFVGVADWFLFDTSTPEYGGSGKTFDWSVLDGYPFDVPFLLSGGLAEGHIDAICSLVKRVPFCMGVDINSRFETRPGYKDVGRIKLFIDKLKLVTSNADSVRKND